jgi:hypothetical protein
MEAVLHMAPTSSMLLMRSVLQYSMSTPQNIDPDPFFKTNELFDNTLVISLGNIQS